MLVGCQCFMKAFVEIRDFSFSFFILFQTIVKQVLTNWDKLLPVRDTRVKVFCLFSGATCYVPSTSANLSNESYKLLWCKFCGSCWEQAAKCSVCSRTGSPSHILCIGFCYLKGMEKAVATWGGERPWGKKGNTYTSLTLFWHGSGMKHTTLSVFTSVNTVSA